MNFANPFIFPEIQSSIVKLFVMHGQIMHCKKGEVVFNETMCVKHTYYVKKGLMSHSYVNNCVNKSNLMSLLPQGSIGGFLDLFSDTKKPCRMIAHQKSVLFALSNDILKNILEHDTELYKQFVDYYAKTHDSVVKGMATLLYFNVEERIKILLTSILFYSGINTDDIKDDRWVEIPYVLRREDFINITYSSVSVVNNILAEWFRKGYIKRTGCGKYFVRTSILENANNWLLENHIYEN